MTNMEFVKGNASNAKLACPCGRVFWTPSGTIVKCPDCKSIWNGNLTKYVIIKLQSKLSEDYVTVFAGKHNNIATCLSEIMGHAPIAFYCSSGICIQEITKDEFEATDQEEVGNNCLQYLRLLGGKF